MRNLLIPLAHTTRSDPKKPMEVRSWKKWFARGVEILDKRSCFLPAKKNTADASSWKGIFAYFCRKISICPIFSDLTWLISSAQFLQKLSAPTIFFKFLFNSWVNCLPFIHPSFKIYSECDTIQISMASYQPGCYWDYLSERGVGILG